LSVAVTRSTLWVCGVASASAPIARFNWSPNTHTVASVVMSLTLVVCDLVLRRKRGTSDHDSCAD
jgi:hypothetical protein